MILPTTTTSGVNLYGTPWVEKPNGVDDQSAEQQVYCRSVVSERDR